LPAAALDTVPKQPKNRENGESENEATGLDTSGSFVLVTFHVKQHPYKQLKQQYFHR
jgi:hypothetical protein